ncbi:hypothetical protein PtrSN002B_000449 [Pyrenophora tritici-repentis]|uniref:Uncharacterized protein n=1 Tax=Pyrenophora tritici-repentis TaxID=45151 RepID=A0A2W1EHS1_9PLEO|nr:hypothetical protein PtrV1_00779 [Pyrenophora tritici-repentis]KAF7576574.1 hypothetical protein PtrM4_008140 [Pyrenophora tritici-repentis]KAI0587447.1 hypothetical protein Alg130_03880 [Pyrenophora tritici-repentis]KAI0589509.1 hypothetical protein Alg215_00303 [Pyrenophora tritici-repentis]KAI0614144.1 hypothetical protein TUN205_01648 [Pyrenophora tritici-repentis]
MQKSINTIIPFLSNQSIQHPKSSYPFLQTPTLIVLPSAEHHLGVPTDLSNYNTNGTDNAPKPRTLPI